eukprot:COSAG02_NODE_4413_length_5385_cov_3.361899_3_plen_243_part_00
MGSGVRERAGGVGEGRRANRTTACGMEPPPAQEEQAVSAVVQEPAKAPPRLMLSKPKPKPALTTESELVPSEIVPAIPKADGDVEAPVVPAEVPSDPSQALKEAAGDTAPSAPQTEREAQSTSLRRQVRPPARLQASAGDGAMIEEAPQVLGLNPRARGARDGAKLEVDWVIDKRAGKDGTEYKVRWVGCGNAEDTWEPLANLVNAKAKVDDFELRDKRKRGEKTRHLTPRMSSPAAAALLC